jgi:antitoxin component YwqK of YwqJK toxin-antitoxin module
MSYQISLFCSIVLLLGLTIGCAFAQTETEPVQVRNEYGVLEEYSVLKSDKSVRQGSYVRYHPAGPLNGVAVYETGTYERGLKEGEWRCFSELYPFNKMLIRGRYHAGLPEGLWVYYYPGRLGSARSKHAVPNGKDAKAGFTVDVEDTTAIVQAKGLCYKGAKIGVWKYYDTNAKLIQAFNYSVNQLIFWQPIVGRSVSGEAIAANHPLLYVGGKARLQMDIIDKLDLYSLHRSGKTGSAVFKFSIDSTGHQTRVALAENMVPNDYEALILSMLSNVGTKWMPQTVDGHLTAADYRVKITATLNDNGLQATVEPLGD